MPSFASGNCCCTACASTWAAEWRMTLRPSSVFAATGSTSASASGAQARSRSFPSASRTTTIVSSPLVGRPASRTAAPAVVPAGTTTREAATGETGGDWDTIGSSSWSDKDDAVDASRRPARASRAWRESRAARPRLPKRPARSASEGLDDLVELQPRQPVEPRVLPRLADVHHDERAPLLVREELVVDALGVEAGHRAGGQAGGADADDEVADLQQRVQLGELDAAL